MAVCGERNVLRKTTFFSSPPDNLILTVCWHIVCYVVSIKADNYMLVLKMFSVWIIADISVTMHRKNSH